ncbi:MAG: FHA domain-containing protein [Myxococcales bacterium]|nr:FHA domain-containing protein [Myxococcales bacterium]
MLALRLVQGTSPNQVWVLDPSQHGARKIVGSDPSAEWQVSAQGVAPGHIEVYWDGQQIWVCDISKLGTVAINQTPVGEWQAAPLGSRITFGGALLEVVPAESASASAPPTAQPVAQPAASAAASAPVPTGPFHASGPSSGVDATTELAPWKRTLIEQKQRVILLGDAALVLLVLVIIIFARRSGGGESTAPEAVGGSVQGGTGPEGTAAAEGTDPFAQFGALTNTPAKELEVADSADAGVDEDPSKTKASELTSPEGRAAAKLISGRYAEAIRLYDALATSHPDRPEFPVVAEVLRERMRRRCANGVGPGGEPCSVP